MTTAFDHEQFVRSLVEQANQNATLMDGTTQPVRQLIDDSDVAIGVWQDPKARYGVGLHVIKGAKLFKESIASGKPFTARVAAIPCECVEQAIAAQRVFGTRDHDA